ncbi:MAG TPA: hypothetical protein VK957_10745 [Lunatimonas sp.]|nr:hypothetical protein [Lunatimonas sp.]
MEKELEEKLEFFSKKVGLSKSKIVKDALTAYLNKNKSSFSAFELGKDLFAIEEGEENLSSTFKEKVKEKLNAKFTH